MTTKREAYTMGRTRGYNVASWVDMPEIGQTLGRDIDWQGIGTIETVEDQLDAWAAMCSAAEGNDRDFSPFESTAHEFNEQLDRSADLWEAFEDGITAGLNAYRRKHYKLASLRRNAKEAA